MERQVVVEPKLEGKPVDGYEVYSVQPNKGSVMLRGPESRVVAVEKVITEGIWLGGHKESFTAPNVAIDVPDPKIDLIDPVVSVNVEIGERRVEKTFSDVATSSTNGARVQPANVSVTLLGPESEVGSLKSGDIKIVFDGNQTRVELPQTVSGKVTLKSMEPGKLVLIN